MEENKQLTEDQSKMVEENMEFAEGIAKAMYRTDIEIGELTGAAYLGLCEAALRWRPGHGTAFRSFAYHRIVGAIKDDIAVIKGYKRGNVLYHAENAENAETSIAEEPSYDPWGQIDDQVSVSLLIERFPPGDRRMLTMFFGLNGERQLAPREIERELGISESTLYRRVGMMIKMMR